ncbi:hypothetical protein BH23GEM9_BH23GEM9_21180 [soil metagenome]
MQPVEPAYEAGFPWPPPPGEPAINALGRTWRGASLEPRTFYRALPAAASLGPALLYYLILGIAVSGAQLFWSVTLRSAEPERDAVLGGMGAGALSPVIQFLLSPLLLLLSLFLAAGVVHLLLRLFGGASRDFGFTTRVFAYAYSPQILGIVPFIGAVIGFIWMLAVAIIGLREGHETSTGKVLAAVLIPLSIGLFFVAVAMFIAAAGDLLTL